MICYVMIWYIIVYYIVLVYIRLYIILYEARLALVCQEVEADLRRAADEEY